MTDAVNVAAKSVPTLAQYLNECVSHGQFKQVARIDVTSKGKIVLTLAPSGALGSGMQFDVVDNGVTPL